MKNLLFRTTEPSDYRTFGLESSHRIMSRQYSFRLDTLIGDITILLHLCPSVGQVHLRCHLLRYIPTTIDKVMCLQTRPPGGRPIAKPLKFPPTSEPRRGSYSPVTYLRPLSYYFSASFVTVCYKLFPLCRL